jgi:hypothetical protein
MAAALLLTTVLADAQVCDRGCSHFFNVGSQYPYVEAIALDQSGTIVGSSKPGMAQWYEIQGPCGVNGEVNGIATFSAALHAYFYVSAATVPVGSHFEVKLALIDADGAEIGSSAYTRVLRVTPSGQNPQGEWFNTILPNIPAGNYRYTLSVRLLADGTMNARTRFITAQGSPSVYGGATSVNPIATTITSDSWALVGSASFTNSSSENVDVEMGGTFSIVGGTTGDKVMLGLGFDDLGSNGHNSIAYVPDASYLPQTVNAFDHLPNEGVTATITPGTHTVQLWAKNLSGHTTTVQYSQVQAIGFPATNGLRGFMRKDSTPAEVTPFHAAPQPRTCIFLDRPNNPGLSACSDGTASAGSGNWTKLGESVVLAPSPGKYFIVGDGYVEILGRDNPEDPEWQKGSWGEIGVEAVMGSGKSTDVHAVSFYVPPGATHLYFFIDAALWENDSGNTVTLWIRKVTGGGFGTYSVGRAYLGVRFLDVASWCVSIPQQ